MTALPVVGIVGTSIADGTGAPALESYPVVACKNAHLPYLILGRGGESMSILNGATHHAVRYALLAMATDVISEHGVNDGISGGAASFATYQSRYATEWAALAAIRTGMRVWQNTLPPSYNTSTDAWLTTTNQGVSPGNTVRLAVNAWLRDGAPYVSGSPAATSTSGASRCNVYGVTGALVTAASGPAGHPLAGVFEVADAWESARDSGIWKADGTTGGKYTGDGVHPFASSVTPTTAAAAAISTAAITAAFTATQGQAAPKTLVKVGGVFRKITP